MQGILFYRAGIERLQSRSRLSEWRLNQVSITEAVVLILKNIYSAFVVAERSRKYCDGGYLQYILGSVACPQASRLLFQVME